MLSKKLKQLRKENRLTQEELARRFGVTQQTIAKWEAGRALPEPETISRIAGFFGVTTDYLLDMTETFRAVGPVSSVRIIGTVRAGYDALALEEDLGSALAEVKNGSEYRYLVVKGDSMAPYIREGDLALVRLQSDLQNGDLGVVIYGDGEATLKKYYCSDGAVTLVPFNDAYETVTLRGSELERLMIFGRVVKTTAAW
ncbi:repressor LexA [Sporobacter termitidis DSM 10068]|uniref:Repressor LexA n=1 Tax=Sporobacter termitidis DSM 10068 TaxID=1123282 RepID=A0A1M5ZFG9_9FIRM|nr:XRE family transcriptional regulator [Sporobacter termitidis]SHI22967.1 repressor LexA [Sporobacter termitidis DSM 10068]